MKKAVFFDLDGTLLDMDLDDFIKAYFGSLLSIAASRGIDPGEFRKGIEASIEAMTKNDGTLTNEEVFWKTMEERIPDVRAQYALFEDFYLNDFNLLEKLGTPQPELVELVRSLKGKARIILATNPFFPSIATHARIRWAGLDPDDFELVTTYENSRASKPSVLYYRNLLDDLGLEPGNVMMVGNDALEDGAAASLGIPVFLLDHHLLNGEFNRGFPVGNIQDLKEAVADFLEDKNEHSDN